MGVFIDGIGFATKALNGETNDFELPILGNVHWLVVIKMFYFPYYQMVG